MVSVRTFPTSLLKGDSRPLRATREVSKGLGSNAAVVLAGL